MPNKFMTYFTLRKNRSSGPEEPTANLTPLIDVVFVILIMFILIAPLLEIEQVQLADASHESKTASQVKESSQIVIHVENNNSILFNGKKISLDQLPLQLSLAKKKFPLAHPQLFQDKRSQFGTYQIIKNSIEEAGFESLDIVLKPG